MGINNDDLSNWTKPAFNNEEELAKNTKNSINSAIQNSPKLKLLNISVFPKGSYANNTNVRRDSDIDIAVRLNSLISIDYDEGLSHSDTGLSPYTGISKSDFKNELYSALINEFGSSNVSNSGNKVFQIRKSDKLMNTDIIPSTIYRRYFQANNYIEGIQLIPDNITINRVNNFPEQHYEYGVEKNKDTKLRYKGIVRIIKNIRNNLLANNDYPSFLIESLAYNMPNSIYTDNDTWVDMLKYMCENALDYLSKEESPNSSERWTEVNKYKFLFHSNQKWDRDDAKELIGDLQTELS